MEKLKKNGLIQIIIMFVSIVGLAVTQYFFYNSYIQWEIAKALPCYFAFGICYFTFGIWFSITGLQKTKTSFILIFSLAVAVILSGVFVGVAALINAVVGNVAAYAVSVGLIDVVILIALGFGLSRLYQVSGKKVFISVVAIFCALIIAGIGLFAGLNAKGPEAVEEFSIADTLEDGKGEKVRVILLGGQSNASGVSRTEYLKKNVSPEKYSEYADGYKNVLINYFDDNGNNASGRFVKTTLNQGCNKGFYGPELGLAETLTREFPNEKFVIIKYAWGGSNLHTQWRSPSSGETGDLYRAFISFVNISMDYLISKNYNASIEAMCWMQGESDSDDVNCLKYGENTAFLVKDVREALCEYVADQGMLFLDAAISQSPIWKNYEKINQAKLEHSKTDDKNIFIDTIGEGLEFEKEPEGQPDLAHYDALSEIKLGELFALAYKSGR